MACSKCAERRRKLKAMLAEKKAKRKGIQAVAIGAVLVASEAAGKVLGIGEDTEDATEQRGTGPSGSTASREGEV